MTTAAICASREFAWSPSFYRGEQIETQNGRWAAVQSVTPVKGLATVYNLTVEEDHDYFVGEQGLLVHNADPAPVLTTVGRWMSPAELEAMQAEGLVQESTLNGVTSVSIPPNPAAYTNAPPGDVFVEFDVPEGAVRNISPNGWGKIFGPNSIFGPKLGITEMPPATNIKVPCE